MLDHNCFMTSKLQVFFFTINVYSSVEPCEKKKKKIIDIEKVINNTLFQKTFKLTDSDNISDTNISH